MTAAAPTEGWRAVKFGSLAQNYLSGGTPSTTDPRLWDGDVPWTTSAPISEEDVTVERAQRYISRAALALSATNLVPAGNLLVGTRVGVGKAVTNRIDMAISQDLTGVILDSDAVGAEFVAYLFKVNRIQQFFGGRKRGTTIQGISRFDLESLDLLLPPVAEQRRIARVLRAAQDATAARRHELALERERKAALMRHLFRGASPEEPLVDAPLGALPQGWGVVRLGDAFDTQLGKMLSQKARSGGDSSRPYVRNANVQWGRVNCADVLQMDFSGHEIRKFRLRRGDLLICEGGEVGRTAMWMGELPECYFQKAIHRLRPRSGELTSEFLLHWMEWAFRYADLYGVAGTQTTIAHLPQDKLRAMWVPKLSLPDQESIAALLTACDAKIAALEREIALHEELFRALLEELMSGRLSVAPLLGAAA